MLQSEQTRGSHPIQIENQQTQPDPNEVRDEVLDSLVAHPPRISCVHFYDARGSRLFEEITALPEYYLTRTEIPLIRQAARELASELVDTEVLELGSGDCSKISLLFEQLDVSLLPHTRYRPIDVSVDAVETSARNLVERFPGLTVEATISDYVRCITTFGGSPRRRLFCFFGSTLGNLDVNTRERFLLDLGAAMARGDQLLLGVDMVKDVDVLENAYNDADGVTDRFNRNVLNVVNRIAGTDFDSELFEHLAFYNAKKARIEMHLRARRDQVITSPHLRDGIVIREGETIHTENSHKFTPESVEYLIKRSHLSQRCLFTDANNWFSLYLLKKP